MQICIKTQEREFLEAPSSLLHATPTIGNPKMSATLSRHDETFY